MASAEDRRIDIDKYDKQMRAEPGPPQLEYSWRSPKETPFGIAGLAWFAQDRAWRRMPLTPPSKLPEAVDSLANMTAGAKIRFVSNSRLAAVRVKLRGLADRCHMPATGQCGFDLYIGPPGQQRYISTAKYDHTKLEYEFLLFERMKLPPERRNMTLNFPLLQGVEEVLVGLEPGAEVLAPPPYRLSRPIVIYGTSIAHGGCASRPGMAYPNILSRRLDAEVFNLGFGGSGRGEPEVARVIATIANPACFVLDYEANTAGLEHLQQTLPDFIRILREAHPSAPIVVVSKTPFSQENFNGSPRSDRLACRDYEKSVVDHLRNRGDVNAWFLDMGASLGEEFNEGTVDGVHPNDLGFALMADVFEPFLRKLLM